MANTNLKAGGDRVFQMVGPQLLNRLPLNIQILLSLVTVRKALKTHLYSDWNTVAKGPFKNIRGELEAFEGCPDFTIHQGGAPRFCQSSDLGHLDFAKY